MLKVSGQEITIGGKPIRGPLENINTVGDLVSIVLDFLIPLAAVILFFVLVWGGYDFLLSRGDPEKVKNAQAKITAGLIGFVLLVVSFMVVKLIAFIFKLGGGIL